MVGPTAQLVALASYFNALVRGARLDAFFPSNSTVKFCEFVHFARRHKGWLGGEKWVIEARTPDEWLARETRPERRAIVSYGRVDDPRISDRMSAGFAGGGGRWRLNLVAGGRMDVWEANWEVGDRQAPDQRIWRVTYGLIAEDADAAALPQESADGLIPEFRRTLSEILAFCGDHELDSFARCFQSANECLAAEASELAYLEDLAPAGLLSLSAKRVLAASQAAWVFGGMGSWNDMGFDGEEGRRYDRLSDQLFGLLNRAICAGANPS